MSIEVTFQYEEQKALFEVFVSGNKKSGSRQLLL